ncbi:hypothetical protein ACVBEH_14485 [Roseateles sp. GG27B]
MSKGMNEVLNCRRLSAVMLCALLCWPAFPARAEVAVATDLKFGEFFTMPVGPRGLEPSAKLLALQGRQVRMLGYMARQDAADALPGVILLTPLPVTLGDEDERYADDLPVTTVYVHLDAAPQSPVLAYLPGLLALTGRLELGSQAEADGRRSSVRLRLDSASSVLRVSAAAASTSFSR